MNCKPGDLAVIVRSNSGNEGVVVTCLRLATKDDFRQYGVWSDTADWLIDRLIRWTHPRAGERMVPIAFDAWLKPLRDSDGDDETLTWAGKPEQVRA